MNLLNINLVKTNISAFSQKVVDISKKLGINPNWLMQVMKQESNINPQAVNKLSKATGLIQFMPSTAIALGTTTADLLKMTNVQQLDYVYKYLQPYANKIKDFDDLYLTILFPVAVGKPDNFVLETKRLSAELIAKMNPIYDLNGDKKVTVKEVRDALLKKVHPDYLDQFVDVVKKNPLTSIITTGLFFF